MGSRMLRLVTMALLAALPCAAFGQLRTKSIPPESPWSPAAPLTVDSSSFADAPANGAGCVVVGYHLLLNGTVANPRIMQAGFVGGTSPATQRAFADGVLAAALRWTFVHSSRTVGPSAAFEWKVVGYTPAKAGAPRVAVVGADGQDPRIRQACQLEDLAHWGAKNAIPAADAPASPGTVLVPFAEPTTAFWVVQGGMQPPMYPPGAFQAGAEGCVVVAALVGSNGVPDQFRIVHKRTSPGKGKASKLMEDASMYAVSQWRFSPGPDNPKRTPALLQFPIQFVLGRTLPKSPCAAVDLRKLAGS